MRRSADSTRSSSNSRTRAYVGVRGSQIHSRITHSVLHTPQCLLHLPDSSIQFPELFFHAVSPFSS